MTVRSHQRSDSQMASRLPTGSSNSTDPAFEGGNTLFEHGIGGIGNPGIHMAGPFGVEY